MEAMTEVQSSAAGGKGVFVTRAFETGDVILEESIPLARLAPTSREDEQKLLDALPPSNKPKGQLKDDGESLSFLSSIHAPSSISQEYKGMFRGMIQVAACFAELGTSSDDETVSKAILELYHPSLSSPSAEEEQAVKVAKEALKHIQSHSKGVSKLKAMSTGSSETLLKVMLVWYFNAFAGGRLYEKQCRVNHSCDPNVFIQTEGEKQVMRAAVPIDAGDEVTSSYLGTFLYADTKTRQAQLLRVKGFTCQCSRCASEQPDIAAAIPCPFCHARDGKCLEEDVQYDDDNVVHYCFPKANNLNSFECENCKKSLTLDKSNNKDPNHALRLAFTVSEKVANFMRDRETPAARQDDDETFAVEEEMEDQLVQLSSSVLGAKHWTTNLMILMILERTLQSQHAAMIAGGDPPELDAIAEAIDSLERVCRFVEGLKLQLHMGHILSNLIIGVARILVGLGDTKSQKYASEWIGKIKDYTNTVESEAMQKVVEALDKAWMKEEGDPAAKKQKLR